MVLRQTLKNFKLTLGKKKYDFNFKIGNVEIDKEMSID